MFILGKKQYIKASELDSLFDKLELQLESLYNTKLEGILCFLESLAVKILESDLAYINSDKAIIKDLLSRDSVLERIRLELGNDKTTDIFSPLSKTHLETKLIPKGIVCQVSANNVFLGVLDNIVSTLITKNILVLKVSSGDNSFMDFLTEKLLAADPDNKIVSFINFIKFKGGDLEFENILKRRSNKLIVWGSEDTVKAYRENLGDFTELKSYGPRISIAIITNEYLQSSGEDLFIKLSKDISRWSQKACSNVQNIFLESGIDSKEFAAKLMLSLPAKELEDKNYFVELLKIKALIEYEQFEGKDSFYIESDNGFIYKNQFSQIEPTVLNHTIAIKTFNNLADLNQQLKPQKNYLQSCALGALGEARAYYTNSLALAGIKRFTFPGQITDSILGAPHEGSYQLSELVNIVYDQFTPSVDEFKMHIKALNPYYKEHSCMIEADLKLDKFNTNQLTDSKEQGLYFTSGATTGKPKVAFYSYHEIELIAYKMAKTYKQAGLQSKDLVLNLFFAGNMWSSFSVIQKAMELIGATQLPLGGNCSEEDFKTICETFRPNIVFGVPGVILRFAQYCKKSEININFDKFFYAGEKLSLSSQKELTNIFGITDFISAGYACVDTGIIGYQSPNCLKSEHIIYENVSDINIKEEQILVTSLLRKSHPIIDYKLSDKLEWSDKSHSKFKLLGRCGEVIFIWGARIDLGIIRECLGDVMFQIFVHQNESIELVVNDEAAKPSVIKAIYDKSNDLKQTLSYEVFSEKFIMTKKEFIINPKTGKQALVLDMR